MRAITDRFIQHPVLAIVVNLAIVLIGLFAIRALPVQQYPTLESSSVVITTFYIGASAETVRGFLTTPIEQAVSSIAGIDYRRVGSFIVCTRREQKNVRYGFSKERTDAIQRAQRV